MSRKQKYSHILGLGAAVVACHRSEEVTQLSQQPCLSGDKTDIGGLMRFAQRASGQAGSSLTGYFDAWMEHFKEVGAPFILVKSWEKGWSLYKERNA